MMLDNRLKNILRTLPVVAALSCSPWVYCAFDDNDTTLEGLLQQEQQRQTQQQAPDDDQQAEAEAPQNPFFQSLPQITTTPDSEQAPDYRDRRFGNSYYQEDQQSSEQALSEEERRSRVYFQTPSKQTQDYPSIYERRGYIREHQGGRPQYYPSHEYRQPTGTVRYR